jgi:hypothetical protein
MAKERSDKDILAEARKRFDVVSTENGEIEDDFKTDVDFISGNQYSDAEKKDRKGRPCLVINKIYAYANQVTNDIRQNEPAPKVRPSNSNNNGAAAEVLDGLLRKIQADGDAEAAVDTAMEYAVYGGFGFFRVLTDYASDKNDDQNIFIKKIGDPLTVKFPFHLCREADYSDVPYAFVTTTISEDEYKARFDDDPKDWDLAERTSSWVSDDGVVLCEYFTRSDKMKKLYRLTDDTFTEDKPEDETTIVSSRDIKGKEVMWYLLSGGKVLEKKVFPGKYIPIVAIVGKEMVVDGKIVFISLTRFARDPQRMYNYWRSMETETIAMAPKAPIVAAEGQLEGRTQEWANANRSNVSVLQYKPVSLNGAMLPPPQRMSQVSVPAGFVNAANEATDDIKSVTGIHDASMGAQGNETSGKAIIARQREGDKANFHFADNTQRGVKHAYKIILNIIPVIFDTARQIRILGEDMKDKVVVVNQEYTNEKGELQYYDLTSGDWDVYLDMGPSYATKRVEAAENMINLMQAVPAIGQFGSDIVVRNMDFNQSDELSERLKRSIAASMPGIVDEEKQVGPDGKPIEQQAQGESPEDMAAIMQDMQNLQQENEALKQQLQQVDVESMKMNQADDHKNKEIERDLTIARMKAQTEIAKAKLSRQNTEHSPAKSETEKD